MISVRGAVKTMSFPSLIRSPGDSKYYDSIRSAATPRTVWPFALVVRCRLNAARFADTIVSNVHTTTDRVREEPVYRHDGCQLHVHGIDMLDGTPILDIKPYLSSVPQDQLRRGWLAEAEARTRRDLKV